jgi:flagellar biogenesis protein FliO
MYKEIIETNVINAAAIGISFADINGLLTAIVLITAAIYNIKKIENEQKD